MDKTKTELSALVGHFRIFNLTEGKSQKTAAWYDESIGLFLRWLEGNGRSTKIGDISEIDVREFILDYQNRPGLKGDKVSSHSVNNRVRALRSFFGWAADNEYTEFHILGKLKLPKTSDLKLDPLVENEIDQILSAINPNTVLGSRNTAIVLLLLDTGIRRGELIGLKLHDVHMEHRYLKVFGKGSKERFVPFGVKCQATMMAYVNHYRGEPANPDIDTFFLTIDGYPMTGEGTKSIMQRLKKTSGVSRLYAHLLRHTYGTNFIQAGGNLYFLQNFMGHESTETTEKYLHVAGDLMAVNGQEFSPVDRMNVRGQRRYRHNPSHTNGIEGHVYPNAGRKRKGRRRRSKSGAQED